MSDGAATGGQGARRLPESLRGRLRSLGYSESGKRDLRLDFLRGLAITAMVIDHIGGDTLLSQLTGANHWIVSAAEFFVFSAGLVLGAVYGNRVRRAGIADATRGLLSHTLTLYRSSVGMGLAFASLYLWTDLRLWRDRAAGLGLDNPVESIVGIATLHHSFHGSDVLVMYTLMLAFSPVIFYLLNKGYTWQVLAGSCATWAVAQQFPNQAPFPWAVTGSSFPVASWQLLLVTGIVAGHHLRSVYRKLNSKIVVLSAACGILLLNWSVSTYGDLSLPALFGDATYASLFEKGGLGPGRVLAFLCMAVLGFTVVNRLWVALYRALGWFLLPMGQKSLNVYVVHLFVVVAIYNLVKLAIWWVPVGTIDLGAQLVGLAVCWALVRSGVTNFIAPIHAVSHETTG